MKKLNKEQLNQLYQTGNKVTQTLLKEFYPNLFEVEIKVGEWYKETWKDGDVDLFFVDKIDGDKLIHNENYFRNKESIFINSSWAKKYISKSFMINDKRVIVQTPTDAEIEEVLTAEAVRRGFVDGCSFVPIGDDGVWTFSEAYKYTFIDGVFQVWSKKIQKTNCSIVVAGFLEIFKNGQWAEIVERPKEMTVEEIEEILGHKVKVIS